MIHAAQIRSCGPAPRANHSLFRPQKHQTIHRQPNRENKACFPNHYRRTRRPDLKISNRESLRLEIHLTHRKQTTGHHSNRENNACFSNHYRRTRHPDLKISNRESLRLEIHLTHRKQTTGHHSNRENNACFSNHYRRTRRPDLKISNREAKRLEIHLTQTKQTIQDHSNREKEACFSDQPAGAGLSRFIRKSRPPFGHFPSCPDPNPRKSAKISENLSEHPSFLFRLESIPTIYFLQLTKKFNRTTFRLRRRPVAQPLRAVSAVSSMQSIRINANQSNRDRQDRPCQTNHATGSISASRRSQFLSRAVCFFRGWASRRARTGAQVSSSEHGRCSGSRRTSGSGLVDSRICLARGLPVRRTCSLSARRILISSADSSAPGSAARTNSSLKMPSARNSFCT